MTHPFATSARTLIANGFSPLPVIPRKKIPALVGWSRYCNRVMSEAELRRLMLATTPYGVSVATGFRGLTGIDIDTENEEVLAALRSVLPRSNIGKRGARGKTFFYVSQAKSQKFVGLDEMLVEILGVGCHTVIPPSVHPDTGEPYTWLGNRSFMNTALGELRELPSDIGDRIGEALRPWLRSARRASQQHHGERSDGETRPSLTDPYIASTVSRLQAELANTKPGSRNIVLNNAALRLGQLGFGIDEVEELLSDIAHEIGLSPGEAARTIASGVTAGARYPRGRSVR